MKIGTPLSPGATRVMLLGSGELGKEVIIALQRFGVEVIAVDRYANAPGHQVAHRAHVIDMADGAALLALVEQEKPHIIVPEIEAIRTEMLAANYNVDRLYTLRNQLLHGGATWNSSVNSSQISQGAEIMGQLVPVVIHLMMNDHQRVWGDACYPVVD